MSAELAVVERKADLALAKLDLVLAELEALKNAGKPGMTQRAFAKLIKLSPRTVRRMVQAKKIKLVRGMVPHSEVQKFLS